METERPVERRTNRGCLWFVVVFQFFAMALLLIVAICALAAAIPGFMGSEELSQGCDDFPPLEVRVQQMHTLLLARS